MRALILVGLLILAGVAVEAQQNTPLSTLTQDTATDGQVLTWFDASKRWYPKTAASGLPLGGTDGWFLGSSNGVPVWTINAGSLSNQFWVNVNGNVGLQSFIGPNKTLYLGPSSGVDGTNSVAVNMKSVAGNPAFADGFTIGFDYGGTGNIPAAATVQLYQANGFVCQEGQTYAYFCFNHTTNVDNIDWLYGGDAAFGTLGTVGGGVANTANFGTSIGVGGQAAGKGVEQAGILGNAQKQVANQTNIGGIFTVTKNGFSGGRHMGVYADIRSAAPGDGTPQDLVDSVFLGDNRDSAYPLIILRTNTGLAFEVDQNGVINLGTTNTAPVSTNAVDWLAIVIGGVTYRIPLMK